MLHCIALEHSENDKLRSLTEKRHKHFLEVKIMKTSENIDKLCEALAIAQGEYGPVKKNKENTYFKNAQGKGSRYSDLSAILEATRPALSKHGLSLVQAPVMREGRAGAITRLMHKSGQWIEIELLLKPNADTSQAVGSSVTYAKRYSAASILGCDVDDDDDGEAAVRGGQSGEPAGQPAEPQPVAEQRTPVFNRSELTQFRKLEVKLRDLNVPPEKHVIIADKFHGKRFSHENLIKILEELQK